MKLVIKRDQQAQKGMLGGHKGVNFTLSYRLQLSDDELQLVQQYKLEDYPLTYRTFQGNRIPDDTVRNMCEGRSQTVSDVTTLVRNEEIVKDACDSLPGLFEVVRTFGGSEVIEYPRH
ncbi:MAG: hypothetical protein ACRDZR_00380 [Acidimicrobiales bacterium]